MPIPMTSRYQRRLWRYVDSGCHRKLRKLLKHHREALDLGEAVGHKTRTPLHRSCARMNHKTATLLLKYGADPCIPDLRGDTALHLVARKVARKGGTVYEDLFVPLRNHCPLALSIRNRDGKLPGDLLGQVEDKWGPQEALEENETECDDDREWKCKLLNEWEDENWETSWEYKDDFDTGSSYGESYEDWADRIAHEYKQKHRRQEKNHQQRAKTEPPKPFPQLRQALEDEHSQYERRAKAKAEELKEAKKKRYEEGCSQIFTASSSSHLRYVDIPWPCPKGTPEEMVAVALHGTDTSDKAAYRRFIRRQQVLWHPDKFVQRCGTRLAAQDRRRILDTVTALSQAFNRIAEAAK